MEIYLLDWAQLLLRWLHVVVAIAWIGASFYFVWLDNHLQPALDPAARERGVIGEVWAVHGGGFYNAQKYRAGPPTIPKPLHWFYWESYWTWISGFALFTAIYLWQPTSYLIDPAVRDWSATAAVAAALGFLVSGWAIYDGLCRGLGRTRDGGLGHERRLAAAIFLFVAAATWIACHLFAGRAAFLITGAMLATIMSANVLMVIIPGQKRTVAALARGAAPNPLDGLRGKQRSVHNTYFTLPVIVAMISNHDGRLTQHAWNWLVLIGLMLAGVLVRWWFVRRHQGKQQPWMIAAALALLAVIVVAVAPRPGPAAVSKTTPGLAEVQAVIVQRCVVCHNAQLANKSVALDTAAGIDAQRQAIYQQVVLQRRMPLNNATGITEDERALIGRWAQAH